MFLARVFNALENLIHTFQNRGPGAVQHLYYRHWLHRYAQKAGSVDGRRASLLMASGNAFDVVIGGCRKKCKMG